MSRRLLPAFLPALLFVSLAAAGPLSTPASAQALQREILRDKLRSDLTSLAGEFEGVAGIQVLDLATGETIGVNADLVFPQGSAIKIPILLELLRRSEADPELLGRRVTLTPEALTGGSGVLKNLTHGGSALSIEDLAILMIVHSDNTATNLVIDLVGMDSVNALTDDLGAPGTRLQRRMIQPEASARGEENLSTPAEAARIMERIARCDLPVSEASCFRIQEILEIPKNGAFRAPIPTSVPVAWKPGGVEGVATAWGLVSLPDRPYAVAIMTSYGGDGSALVRAASEVVYRYFARLDRSSEYGVRVPIDVIRRIRAERAGGGP